MTTLKECLEISLIIYENAEKLNANKETIEFTKKLEFLISKLGENYVVPTAYTFKDIPNDLKSLCRGCACWPRIRNLDEQYYFSENEWAIHLKNRFEEQTHNQD